MGTVLTDGWHGHKHVGHTEHGIQLIVPGNGENMNHKAQLGWSVNKANKRTDILSTDILFLHQRDVLSLVTEQQHNFLDSLAGILLVKVTAKCLINSLMFGELYKWS